MQQKPDPKTPQKPPSPEVLQVVPPTGSVAKPKRRHRVLLATFLLFVLFPVGLTIGYLYNWAEDQYASTAGFLVRKEEAPSSVELLGGIPELGGSTNADAEVLYEFLYSQEIVKVLNDRIALAEIYSKPQNDPIFAYDPSGSIEDLHSHWQRMVRIAYDDASGLIEFQAFAFSPEDARLITEEVLKESSALVNDLSSIAQEDTIRFAQTEVDLAVERLINARQALTAFRSRTQIVDPLTDVQGQMGLLTTLQTQLAEAYIELDLLRENTLEGDIRIRQLEQRVRVIESRIAQERGKLGVGTSGTPGSQENYAALFAEFERLSVDREFAETSYTAALIAYDAAVAEARRQNRYLAVFIKPTLAEKSEYPQKLRLTGIVALFLTLGWAIAAMIYYSVRDRR